MNAVIYARYSSDNQREESIEGQLRECESFAKKNDMTLVYTYIDRALSAKTDNRSDFQKMIKDSTGHKFDVIIVWKLDRFARNRYDSAYYKSMLSKNGVKVVSATESISECSEGILLESVLEGMAEYYSAELSEKVLRGLTENALKCKYNGGTLPIGYLVDENQFFILDPVAAPIVLDAFKHYAEGSTMQEITDVMNLKGIRTKRGGKISINSVTRMLHNRKYIGEYQYRDVIQPKGIPDIVPEDLFERVQERMAANKKAPAKHKAEDEYLLTTKLYCGKCKSMMAGESGTSHMSIVHHYYKCVNVKHHGGCDKKTVKKRWIEDLVIGKVKDFLDDDDAIDKLARQAVELLEADNTVLPMLQKQYAEAEKSIANLIYAIEQGIITPSTKIRLQELEAQKSELYVQIAKEQMARPTVTYEQISFWLRKLRTLDIKKLDHRRRLIDTFVNSIFLHEDRVVITFNYQRETKTITFADLEKSALGSGLTALAASFRVFITDFSYEYSISLCNNRLFYVCRSGKLLRFVFWLSAACFTDKFLHLLKSSTVNNRFMLVLEDCPLVLCVDKSGFILKGF